MRCGVDKGRSKRRWVVCDQHVHQAGGGLIGARKWGFAMKQTIGLAVAMVASGLGMLAMPAGPVAAADGTLILAQVQPVPPQGAAPPPAAKKQTRPTPPPTGVTPGAPPVEGKAGDGALRQRIEQLEEQLTDLQVTMGTLESLARTTGTAASSAQFRGPGGATGSDPGRVDAQDAQIKALLQQLEQMNDRVRALEAGGGGGGRIAAAPLPPAASPRPPVQQPTVQPPAAVAGFGQTTVIPNARRPTDNIGQLLNEGEEGSALRAPPPAGQVAAADPAGQTPQQLYERAYGYLINQDYGAAEVAFAEFMQRHATHQLAGNAQFWLGETYFFRSQFKAAAAAYYKGYQTYTTSAKAPDSLLKLAMSLARLGQRDAACTSFAELSTKYPNANAQIKSRSQSESQRLACQ